MATNACVVLSAMVSSTLEVHSVRCNFEIGMLWSCNYSIDDTIQEHVYPTDCLRGASRYHIVQAAMLASVPFQEQGGREFMNCNRARSLLGKDRSYRLQRTVNALFLTCTPYVQSPYFYKLVRNLHWNRLTLCDKLSGRLRTRGHCKPLFYSSKYFEIFLLRCAWQFRTYYARVVAKALV